MTKYHENLLRDSTLSSHSMVKFISSLETKMILKIPNESFLRNTLYLLFFLFAKSRCLSDHAVSYLLARSLNHKVIDQ